MKKRAFGFLLAAAAAFVLTVPAAAATYTSSDGVLSIDFPNDNWKEIQDPTKWIALSDGGNVITIDHYSNGEKLPEMTVADDHYVNTYQAVFSTQNEVFVITGLVVDSAAISDIANAIISAKVLQFNTKLAVKQTQTAETAASATGQYTLAPTDKTMYVTSNGLNVRSGYSTSDPIIGALTYGAAVRVTAIVQRDGADIGWYQISYNSGQGYVSAEFLSDTMPSGSEAATSQANNSVIFTGEARTLYEIDGHAVTVYKAADGNWYDGEGHMYTQTTDYDYVADNGAPLTVNPPQTSETNVPLADGFTAFYQNGNATHLIPYSDGYYYSSEWIRYSDNGDGSYYGADGTILYDYDPWSGSPEDSYESDEGVEGQTNVETHQLIGIDGSTVTVWSSSDGSIIDENGNYYYYADDGSLYDGAENFYSMLW